MGLTNMIHRHGKHVSNIFEACSDKTKKETGRWTLYDGNSVLQQCFLSQCLSHLRRFVLSDQVMMPNLGWDVTWTWMNFAEHGWTWMNHVKSHQSILWKHSIYVWMFLAFRNSCVRVCVTCVRFHFEFATLKIGLAPDRISRQRILHSMILTINLRTYN